MISDKITIGVDGDDVVSGILTVPDNAVACCALAHGAGAGMSHPFISAMSEGLAARRIATLRYQFPYMEQGSRRVDRPAKAHATVRAAVIAAARLVPALPLVAGGKSFGGRMTSEAQAETPLPGVRGLVFIGFPLHPAGKPSDLRARHLSQISIPMLFLQGTRDALAEQRLLGPAIERLGGGTTLCLIEGADHSFHVPARSGRTDRQALDELLVAFAAWVEVIAR